MEKLKYTNVKSIGKVKVQEKYNVRNLKVTKFKLHWYEWKLQFERGRQPLISTWIQASPVIGYVGFYLEKPPLM